MKVWILNQKKPQIYLPKVRNFEVFRFNVSNCRPFLFIHLKATSRSNSTCWLLSQKPFLVNFFDYLSHARSTKQFMPTSISYLCTWIKYFMKYGSVALDLYRIHHLIISFIIYIPILNFSVKLTVQEILSKNSRY